MLDISTKPEVFTRIFKQKIFLPNSRNISLRMYRLYRLRWSRGIVLALTPKFAGSNPAEFIGFLGRKIPQQAIFRRESKAVGPMS